MTEVLFESMTNFGDSSVNVFALHFAHRAASSHLSVESFPLPIEPPAPPAGWHVLPEDNLSLPEGPLSAAWPWQHSNTAVRTAYYIFYF